MTTWSHLPNAVHIDRVLSDIKTNPTSWSTALSLTTVTYTDVISGGMFRSAIGSAREVLYASNDNKSTLDAIGDAAWAVTRSPNVYTAAANTILALMAWPESGAYLALPVDQVRVMEVLGDQRAILMLPAVIAFDKSREST